ncbi:hypothetical protein HDE_13928 [Halotydeus destructor]|nr:hypothetical protein HDE_13928 [Halotydeus destructor]
MFIAQAAILFATLVNFQSVTCDNSTSTTGKPTTVARPRIVYREYAFSNCSEQNLDECGKVVFLFGNRDVHLPVNEKQMRPHCKEEKQASKCVLDWGRNCLKSFPRQSLYLMMSGANKNIRERCSKSGTERYLKNKKCVRRAADSQHTCMEQLTSDLNSVRSLSNKSDWLPSVCCFIDKWKKCFEAGAKTHCKQDGVDFLRWGADAYVSDLTDLACGSKLLWETTRCSNLNEAIMKVPKSNVTELAPKSIITSMLRITTGYADWEKRGPPKFTRLEVNANIKLYSDFVRLIATIIITMKSIIILALIGVCLAAQESKVHEYVLKQQETQGQPEHPVHLDSSPNSHKHDPLVTPVSILNDDKVDADHWHEDFIIARDQGSDSLRSFLETLKAEKERVKERYVEIKEDAHNVGRAWHEKLEKLKEIEQQAEEQLKAASSRDRRAAEGELPVVEEEGFLDRLIHKLTPDSKEANANPSFW